MPTKHGVELRDDGKAVAFLPTGEYVVQEAFFPPDTDISPVEALEAVLELDDFLTKQIQSGAMVEVHKAGEFGIHVIDSRKLDLYIADGFTLVED